METIQLKNELIEILKKDVESHPVLSHPWLVQRKEKLTREDLCLWLSQEYFVSVEFVNWFLKVASNTNNIEAKIILVHNIWEELGEGISSDSHVKILEKFLSDIDFNFTNLKLRDGTNNYLSKMREIIETDFYKGIGALGPANEYLLKLEYGAMYKSYLELKKESNLPEAKFFKVNLLADESHSEKLFRLIQSVCDSDEKKEKVLQGNREALDARTLFYEGL